MLQGYDLAADHGKFSAFLQPMELRPASLQAELCAPPPSRTPVPWHTLIQSVACGENLVLIVC